MTLRNKTIDNGVKYIPSTNSLPSEHFHDHEPETNSNFKKQNKNLPQNNKNFTRDYRTGEGFRMVK